MIITCKGIKKNGTVEKCSFLHDGDWGDDELNQHQNFHESNNGGLSWLGFDTLLSFGKYSGRDGKL
jgi:hypothetical protein